jgi:hypothetical protein
MHYQIGSKYTYNLPWVYGSTQKADWNIIFEEKIKGNCVFEILERRRCPHCYMCEIFDKDKCKGKIFVKGIIGAEFHTIKRNGEIKGYTTCPYFIDGTPIYKEVGESKPTYESTPNVTMEDTFNNGVYLGCTKVQKGIKAPGIGIWLNEDEDDESNTKRNRRRVLQNLNDYDQENFIKRLKTAMAAWKRVYGKKGYIEAKKLYEFAKEVNKKHKESSNCVMCNNEKPSNKTGICEECWEEYTGPKDNVEYDKWEVK